MAQRIVFAFDALRLVVGLDGAPSGHRQRIGLLASQPGLGEADVVALEEQAIGLGPDAHPLAVAHRHGAPRPFLESLADSEVVEGDAQ